MATNFEKFSEFIEGTKTTFLKTEFVDEAFYVIPVKSFNGNNFEIHVSFNKETGEFIDILVDTLGHDQPSD